MSKLTRAKTDLIFLKKYLENMKEHEWRYAEYDMPKSKKRSRISGVTAIKTGKKGPFKVVITELCDTEEDAKLLLNSIIKTGTVNKKSARIIQTRNKNKGAK